LVAWFASLASAAATPLATKVAPGYVFDQPRILTQQRLFGLAHGVSLLADHCFDDAAHGEDVRQAYAAWQQRQTATVALAQQELAHYYFAERATEATWPDLVSALGLKNALPARLDAAKLKVACATLPQALASAKTDLAAQFHLQAQVSRLTSAAETEARAEACRTTQNGDNVAALTTALDAWRQRYHGAVGEARRAVEQRWQEAKLDGTLDQWLNQARNKGRHEANSNTCGGLAAWMAIPSADPDASFQPAP
jgi:hypothetical protein